MGRTQYVLTCLSPVHVGTRDRLTISWIPDGLFPRTRRIGYGGGAPLYPLGWVRVEPEGGRT